MHTYNTHIHTYIQVHIHFKETETGVFKFGKPTNHSGNTSL